MHRSLMLSLLLAWVVGAEALEDNDGIHRIDKQPQTTRVGRLHPRDGSYGCGIDLKLCPSSLGGNCCPENYECGKERCYATTKGPSICGTKIGWYACAAVYGGGCCPDGYMCQRAANCMPPSGSPYSFGCPASQYLCPSSMSYGCCPDGMGCGVDQCYSGPMPMTTAMVLTTTNQGHVTELTMTNMAMRSPAAPTVFPGLGDEDQRVLKYYPVAVPKVALPRRDVEGSGSGISKAQLGGIVTGCISFAILLLLAAFLLWRRFRSIGETAGKETQNLETSLESLGAGNADEMSESPLVRSPHLSSSRPGPGESEPSSVRGSPMPALTEQTPTTPVSGELLGSPLRRAGSSLDHGSRWSPASYGEHAGLPAKSASRDSSPVYGGHTRTMSELSDVLSSADGGAPWKRAPP